jgi:flagellar hook-length control protein FliK
MIGLEEGFLPGKASLPIASPMPSDATGGDEAAVEKTTPSDPTFAALLCQALLPVPGVSVSPAVQSEGPSSGQSFACSTEVTLPLSIPSRTSVASAETENLSAIVAQMTPVTEDEATPSINARTDVPPAKASENEAAIQQGNGPVLDEAESARQTIGQELARIVGEQGGKKQDQADGFPLNWSVGRESIVEGMFKPGVVSAEATKGLSEVAEKFSNPIARAENVLAGDQRILSSLLFRDAGKSDLWRSAATLELDTDALSESRVDERASEPVSSGVRSGSAGHSVQSPDENIENASTSASDAVSEKNSIIGTKTAARVMVSEPAPSSVGREFHADDKQSAASESDVMEQNPQRTEESKPFAVPETKQSSSQPSTSHVANTDAVNKAMPVEASATRPLVTTAETLAQGTPSVRERVPLPEDFARNLAVTIADDLKLHIQGSSSEVRVHMKPESLGELSLRVVLQDGELAAQLDVSQAAVKATLEAQLPQLREALSLQGIKIQRFDIVNNPEMRFGNSREGNSEHHRSHAKRHEDVEVSGEREEPKYFGYNTVEYII